MRAVYAQGILYTPKLYILQKALYTRKAALYTLKNPVYTQKSSLYTQKEPYIPKRGRIHSVQSGIWS